MPKMKTKSGVKKRFKLTATGKITHRHCNHNHLLTKKNARRKRHLRAGDLLAGANFKRVRRMLLT